MVKKGLIILSTIILLFFAYNANAQLQNNDIALSIVPEYPGPNSNVTINISTYSTDISKAKISWYLDGNLSLEGIGKRSFSFTTGTVGSNSTLQVKIEDTKGITVEKQLIISPSSIDMLWEAYDAHVPPFYKGKKLGTNEGMYKITAIPNSKNALGFIYNWKLDGTSKQGSSGYEKNFYTFKKSYLDDINSIEVKTTDLLGNNIGAGNISVGATEPKIIFYEKDLSFGTKWESALGDNFSINQDGSTIVAEPFFFSKTGNNLSFKWYLNGEEVNNNSNEISIKPKEGDKGYSTIKIVINNIKTLFQGKEEKLNVTF